MKKYFVFSDVHGEYDALMEALYDAGYNKENQCHWLISLGDLFDRGDKSFEVFEFLREIPNKILIFGNHDAFLLDFLEGNIKDFQFNCRYNGLWKTIESFMGFGSINWGDVFSGGESQLAKDINEKYPALKPFLQNSKKVDLVKLDNIILTHGGFTENALTGEFIVDHWAHTAKFIKNTYGKHKGLKFIFGHFGSARLKEAVLNVYDEPAEEPFVLENYKSLDIISNLTKKVYVEIIETKSNPTMMGGNIKLRDLYIFNVINNMVAVT